MKPFRLFPPLYGRAPLTAMPADGSGKEILRHLATTEEGLLSRWKASLQTAPETLVR